MARGLEKEVKYRVDCGELGRLLEKLKGMGANAWGPVREEDFYYNHPCRDFASTDEAVRLRVRDGRLTVAYKGPRLGVGPLKERVELEVEASGPVREVIEWLGFRLVARIVKDRHYIDYRGHTITLDVVDGLGCFVEVEGPEPERVAAEVGVRGEAVGETYLELLLRKRRGG